MRRTNISDGNSMTRFFSRWIRWISTGMAIAPRPARNSGVRKDIRRASRRAGLQACSRLAGSPEGLRYIVAPSPDGLRYVRSSHSHQALARREIAEQRTVERFGGVQHGVIDAVLGELGGQRGDVRLDHLAVFLD